MQTFGVSSILVCSCRQNCSIYSQFANHVTKRVVFTQICALRHAKPWLLMSIIIFLILGFCLNPAEFQGFFHWTSIFSILIYFMLRSIFVIIRFLILHPSLIGAEKLCEEPADVENSAFSQGLLKRNWQCKTL